MRRSLLAAVSFLLGACALGPGPRLAPAGSDDVAAEVRAHGRDGDWLVIRGEHLSDALVAAITDSPFSHVAVLDLTNDRVIEAEAQGVHVTPLREFTAKARRLMVVRPMWSDAASAEHAVRKAQAAVGKPYDVLGLIGLDTPERFYCSGLAVEVYRDRIRAADGVPRPVEPGQMHRWGRVLYDTGPATRA